MNNKDFIGNYRYWPLAYSSNSFQIQKSEEDSINNYWVPISELAITEKISTLSYVLYNERVYFLKNNISNTIYSQYFPDASKNKANSVKSFVEIAKEKFRNDTYEEYKLEYSILQIVSTKRHLFALAKAKNEYYFLNIYLTINGFGEKIDVQEIKLPHKSLNIENAELGIFTINEYESIIYFFLKESKDIYIGNYRSSKKNFVISNKLNDLTKQKYSPDSFCVIKNLDIPTLALYDNQTNTLHILEYKEIKKKYTEIQKIKLPEKIVGIKSFYIDSQNITPHISSFRLNLLLLYNHSKLWIINYHNNNCTPQLLIGNGKTHISKPMFSPNLINCRFNHLSNIYTIDNNCIIFSDKQNPIKSLETYKLYENHHLPIPEEQLNEDKLYALLLYKTREIWMLHHSKQISQKDFNLS